MKRPLIPILLLIAVVGLVVIFGISPRHQNTPSNSQNSNTNLHLPTLPSAETSENPPASNPSVGVVSSATLFNTPSGRYDTQVFSSSDIKVLYNLTYANAVNMSGTNQALTLDLYLPPDPMSTSVRPAVIVIHGGGFSAGSKEGDKMIDWSRDLLARRGYVSAAINYRLTKGNDDSTGPLEAVSDAQAAVRWLRAHATEYQIDPNRIAMMGVSAGAIIALFGATADDNVGNFKALDAEVKENTSNPGYPSWICYAVSASGTIRDFLRVEILDAGDAPVVDFHGVNDTTVLYQSAVDTINAFKALGIPALLYSYPGYGHNVPDDDFDAKAIPLLHQYLVSGNCPR